MEKSKAQELITLTQNFCEQFSSIAGKECKDCGIVLTLHIEDDEKEYNISMTHGTIGDELIAICHLDEENHIIRKYAKVASAAAIKVLQKTLTDIDLPDEQPTDLSPSDTDQQ